LSVSDKTGLPEFGRQLIAAGYDLISTGGTLRALTEAGLEVTGVSDVTAYPEVFGGRVKTLHPVVHGGILYRRDHPEDEAQRREVGVEPIDLVVVNLYPFEATVAKPETTLAEAIEKIDIGGPTMVRAAAKNHAHVAVVVDPADYQAVADEIEADGAVGAQTRARLALKAFEHTAHYDAAISAYLAENLERTTPDDSLDDAYEAAPPAAPRATSESMELRYGENPHQQASLYSTSDAVLLGGAKVLQGKALSYNNLIDVDAAIMAVAEFDQAAAVVVKHTNPCGVGVGAEDLGLALTRAMNGDPQSAFGGIVALNRPCDSATAKQLAGRFLEVVAAPSFSRPALSLLRKKKNMRLLEIDIERVAASSHSTYRSTSLGMLVQSADPPIDGKAHKRWEVATERKPSPLELRALALVWPVCKHVKSNAIVVGSNQRTFGIGAGQMSRVDAVRIALQKSTQEGDLLCLASDAFFPFRDSIDIAAEAGVTAVVQPGGSKRDPEVIAAANEHGIAMVFTGKRHFKH